MEIARRLGPLWLLLALLLLAPVPAALAEGDPEFAEPQPIDGPAVDDSGAISAELVVYDMYFPIQGGSDYTDNFGDCRGGAGCPRSHEGIDILQPKMTPVLAVASGTVGWMQNEQGGNCCAMALIHDDGWESWSIHLNNDTPGTDDGLGWGFAPGIVPGARVEAGQLLGWVGDSGNAEAGPSHVHFELHQPGGAVVNPYPSLQAAAVLNAPLGDGATAGCDFDGDGYHDLAIGVPGEDTSGNTKVDSGIAAVMYGSSSGLTTSRAEVWDQGEPGVDSGPKSDEEFGYATACGDINNDGFDDLVVGAPGEAVSGEADSGAINLIFGSPDGLAASGSNFWHQDRSGVSNHAEAGDRFGSALAVGDFDNDGFDDVAVGVPGEKVAGEDGAGQVTILYGSPSGFDGDSDPFHEATAGVSGVPNAGDGFGSALAVGDFDDDGYDDLAIGIPGEDSPNKVDAGAVVVLYGSDSGLTTSREERWHQGTSGIKGGRAAGDLFGAALATGDFDGDGRYDLAAGVPGDGAGGSDAGSVNVIYGSAAGLTAGGDQLFSQGIGGVLGNSESGDSFGYALTIGDFDADGDQDLAVGIPGRQVSGVAAAGSVAVLYGSSGGLTAEGDDVWSQDTFGIKGTANTGDMFGQWLTAGDFAGLGVSSLAVGVPLEDLGSKDDAGSVQVIVGQVVVGLDEADDQKWDQGSSGMPGKTETGDGFGRLGPAAH